MSRSDSRSRSGLANPPREQPKLLIPICPLWEYGITFKGTREDAMGPQLVETDGRSRVVLPGHANERFLVRENADGSILLMPARVVSEAQYEYDNSPELQEILERAAESGYSAKRRKRV